MVTLNPPPIASIALLAAALLTGCATAPTPYQPATNLHGYTSENVGDGLIRVSFRGNSETSRDEVEASLFHRMVDIAEENFAGSFTIVGRETACTTTLRTSPDTACTYRQSADAMFPYYFGVYELNSPWHSKPKREYEAVATIRLSPEPVCGDYADCFVTADARAAISENPA
ncbi:hypothetical protein L53_15645 [Hyphomonas sp. L-53-1-40]|uniref:CC0125/CC1285 family lipoprotein n=1 Tax=Hyphomonas sp. L-53-1-40 TaxID=1207058 RepID=UPI000458CD03|nr:hypothetical protein [Hyphomonas sp. L-53-1-40]KCZ65448.1 hypothetical protein L53_15645 [Hyphomonas sp. L-53-1-40]